jgi:beta-galactosidase
MEVPQEQENTHFNSAVNISGIDDQIDLEVENGKITFDSSTGHLISFAIHDKQLIAGPLVPNFWRAPVDNDLIAAMWVPIVEPILSKRAFWADASERVKLNQFKLEQLADGSVRVQTGYKVPAGKSALELDYLVFPNGDIAVSYSFEPRREMVRVGVSFEIPSEFNHVRYFGLGPHETMPDRMASGAVGVYQSTVEDLIHNYTHPQENGNRSQVRWASLYNKNENGIQINAKGDSLLNFSAWPYTQKDLETAKHIHELPRREEITINVGYAQKGVGDLLSYLHGYPESAILPAKQMYSFSFLIRPNK